MFIISNTSINHNKDCDGDKVEIWSYSHLFDNIINDLMSANDNKYNNYIIQAFTKFHDFRRKSPDAIFIIYNLDLKEGTKKEIEPYIKNCKTVEEAYNKLDGIITEVIAWIFKQAEPLILSNIQYEDPVLVKKSINEIRSCISKKWRFI
jgi:hypothetical protein